MTNDQKKIQKRIKILSQNIQMLRLTGDEKKFLKLSKRYQFDRNRIKNEILRRYDYLFAIMENVRELSILGVQNIDLLVQKNEADFSNCIKRYQTLKPMTIKYMDILDEIICLVKYGLTDGAMQRWRTFFEYSVIIIFILQQGEEVADAYVNSWLKSVEGELNPRTNLAWAKAADCLKGKKQISIKMLLENIHGIDKRFVKHSQAIYKLICQLIHGSPFGINMSFNDNMSEEINDLKLKHADYYDGGTVTVITHTMYLLFQTYIIYFNIFPDGEQNIKGLLEQLKHEYKKVIKNIED